MIDGTRIQSKAFLIEKVTQRVLTLERERCQSKKISLEILLNEAVLQEQERLSTERSSRERESQKRFWKDVARQFHSVSDTERETILIRIIGMYIEEIHSTFNPKLHGLVARIVPWFLKILLNRLTPTKLFETVENRLNLEENLILTGDLESLRQLAKQATLILVPTHVSNLDSLVIGLGLHQARLPPFTYGAGLNLFSNPILAFFMNRLGAYKVDRRKKNTIYIDTLKQYATLLMESGQHSLFFPGGTRNRRGDVERHLKLGLLGCGLSAYITNLQAKKPNPDLFIVPATLSYGLVLEAESLVAATLRAEGKNRYIHITEGFSRPMRLLKFWRNLQSLDSKIHLHFGTPLDLFGNDVDAEGKSRDRQGRQVDRTKYVSRQGQPLSLPQRDQEYTQELGRALATAYLKNNLALCTHVAAFAAFDALRQASSEPDFFQFLRRSGSDLSAANEDVLRRMNILLQLLRQAEQAGKIRLEPLLYQDPFKVFAAALSHFRSYHDNSVLQEKENQVFSTDLKLLYYYRNHLDHYGFTT